VQTERVLPISRNVILTLGALAISFMQFSSLVLAQSSKHSKTKGKVSAIVQRACLKPAQSLPAVFSEHQCIFPYKCVNLSWNPSLPSPSHSRADGYCVYRSLKQGDARLGENCQACELLNLTSMPNTTYVDRDVNYGLMYFYAVTAVNASGPSDASNETCASLRFDMPFCEGAKSSEKNSQQK
jgi:hypothetical protein